MVLQRFASASPPVLRAAVVAFALLVGSSAFSADPYAGARSAMIDAIKQDVIDTSRYLNKATFDSRVLKVMGDVPRHEYVPVTWREDAYENRPLPIGHGQTISQPYIVALMTDLLRVNKNDRVLEIGTGSGYQAAILAALGAEVFTIEIIEPLAQAATARFARLGTKNVLVRHGDGYYGWPKHAPFDAIIVTAAASHVPPPLIKQLKSGGRLVIPVGGRFLTQQLLLIEKSSKGETTTRQILPVRFVPFTGGH